MGLSLFLSVLSLINGALIRRSCFILNFFIMSLLTIAAYWGWFFYLKFIVRESEANKEVKLVVEIK